MGPGRKFDNGKNRVDLLPVGALLEVGKVVTFGAEKYEENNWQNVQPRRRYYAAALRHIWARIRGERIDPESGLLHLAHAACCILFLLSYEVGHDNPEELEPNDHFCPKCNHDMCICIKECICAYSVRLFDCPKHPDVKATVDIVRSGAV